MSITKAYADIWCLFNAEKNSYFLKTALSLVINWLFSFGAEKTMVVLLMLCIYAVKETILLVMHHSALLAPFSVTWEEKCYMNLSISS